MFGTMFIYRYDYVQIFILSDLQLNVTDTSPESAVGREVVEGGDSKTTNTSAYGNIEAIEITATGTISHTCICIIIRALVDAHKSKRFQTL